jgi:hypothetical protein
MSTQSATAYGDHAWRTIIPLPDAGSWIANHVPFQSVSTRD